MAFYSYVIVIKSHVGMEAMKYIVKNHQLRRGHQYRKILACGAVNVMEK